MNALVLWLGQCAALCFSGEKAEGAGSIRQICLRPCALPEAHCLKGQDCSLRGLWFGEAEAVHRVDLDWILFCCCCCHWLAGNFCSMRGISKELLPLILWKWIMFFFAHSPEFVFKLLKLVSVRRFSFVLLLLKIEGIPLGIIHLFRFSLLTSEYF